MQSIGSAPYTTGNDRSLSDIRCPINISKGADVTADVTGCGIKML